VSRIDRWYGTFRRWWNYFNPTPEQFDTDALKNREKYRPDYRILASSLLDHLEFQSVFDVGCGQGFLLEPLHEKGKEIRGVELSQDVQEFLPEEIKDQVDIGDFGEARGSYDLVCCIEVAEHIEPARSNELVDTLCALSNELIYFTAATPGQPGHGHINCRPHEHWMKWFGRRGWRVDQIATQKVREDLDEVAHTHWLKSNSFVLRVR